MASDRADETRAQRRDSLTEADFRARQAEQDNAVGRWGRLRSWVTALLALGVVAICLLLLRHVPGGGS